MQSRPQSCPFAVQSNKNQTESCTKGFHRKNLRSFACKGIPDSPTLSARNKSTSFQLLQRRGPRSASQWLLASRIQTFRPPPGNSDKCHTLEWHHNVQPINKPSWRPTLQGRLLSSLPTSSQQPSRLRGVLHPAPQVTTRSVTHKGSWAIQQFTLNYAGDG